MRALLLICFTLCSGLALRACIWDSDTLADEQKKAPDMAALVLGQTNPPPDPGPLRERIQKLQAAPRTNDPAWWNDLAGAHLRLGEAQAAVDLLTPVVGQFDDDYGIHANLGTAYHLLGRYADAEKEIARDLAINPDGHFGLEKYHLALLQYLTRDADYRSRHVFVDEYTGPFFEGHGPNMRYWEANKIRDERLKYEDMASLRAHYQNLTNDVTRNADIEYELSEVLEDMAALDTPPPYRADWNLAENTNFEKGVIYMSEMNPQEPACFVMLGIINWRDRHMNLAVTAFRRAIDLGSPQSDILKRKTLGLMNHIAESQRLDVKHRERVLISSLMGDGLILVMMGLLLLVLVRMYVSHRMQ
jgi:tetratricopeptide (TPR) repeat protein